MQELKLFAGTWKQISCAVEGVANPPEDYGHEPLVAIFGNKFVVTRADGTVAIEGTFTFDPSRSPKAMDWTDTYGADAGKTFPAIYYFEADKFVFCAADAGQERPTSFQPQNGQVLRVHQRLAER